MVGFRELGGVSSSGSGNVLVAVPTITSSSTLRCTLHSSIL